MPIIKLSDRVKVGVTGNYIVTDAPTLPGGPSGNRAAGVMLQFTLVWTPG